MIRPEMTHKQPSYKNARWLRKRPSAPRWTQKIYRLPEDLMEADETEAEMDMEAVVHDLWKILLDKSGKDALEAKIKEHKKKQKHEEKRQRKKERRKEKKGRKSSKRSKGRHGSPDSTSSSSDNCSCDSDLGSSSSGSSSSSGRSTKRQKDRGGQKGAHQPEFKWIDGKRHFKSKKSGDWVCCEGPPKSACPDCGGHHWWFDLRFAISKPKFGLCCFEYGLFCCGCLYSCLLYLRDAGFGFQLAGRTSASWWHARWTNYWIGRSPGAGEQGDGGGLEYRIRGGPRKSALRDQRPDQRGGGVCGVETPGRRIP